MKMNSLISIIVPIYNTESYLKECLDSIIGQSYHNLEIILVDDGSTDSSVIICDEYAKKDERFKVIHQKNGGRSVARNTGLDNVTGAYIAFVDSDDVIHPEYISTLYGVLKTNNANISVCNHQNFIDEVDFGISLKETVEIYGDEFVEFEFDDAWYVDSTVLWNKLYEKEVFQSLRFPIGFVQEDTYIFQDIFDKENHYTIAYTPNPLYYYRQGVENSIMMYDDTSTERFDSMVVLLERRINYYKVKNYNPRLRKESEMRLAYLYYRSIKYNRNIDFIKKEMLHNIKMLCHVVSHQKGLRGKLWLMKKTFFSR